MTRFLALLLLVVAAPVTAQATFSSERIGVTVRGAGPDVILIPDLTSSPEVWDSTVASIPGYRYHLVHVSGFASRPSGANANGPVIVPVAEEIARYIREQRLTRPAVVGHSMGGIWAMIIAGRRPELVSRVMVVDILPFGAAMGGPTITPDMMRPMAEQLRVSMTNIQGEDRRSYLEQIVASMVRTESVRAGLVAQGLASDPVVAAQSMYDLFTTDFRPDVARIRVPLTVLWAYPPDAPVSLEDWTAFFAASYAGAPQAVIRQIPESYHFIMFDQPEVFQREVRAFLTAR